MLGAFATGMPAFSPELVKTVRPAVALGFGVMRRVKAGVLLRWLPVKNLKLRRELGAAIDLFMHGVVQQVASAQERRRKIRSFCLFKVAALFHRAFGLVLITL